MLALFTGVAFNGCGEITGSGGSAASTVSVSVSSIDITVPHAVPRVGQIQQLQAIARDASGKELAGTTFTWSSADSTVARVSSTGSVTAVAPGTAAISASAGGKVGTATLSVTLVPVGSVSVKGTVTSLYVGQAAQLTAVVLDTAGNSLSNRTITWASSAPAVAGVSNTGRIAALALGTTTVTASVDGKAGSMTLTVTQAPVASVTVAVAAASLQVGQTTHATATVRDPLGTVLTDRVVSWSSSNGAVATVSTAGAVVAMGAGTASITATSEGVAGSAVVTVTSAPPPPPQVTSLAITTQPSTTAQSGAPLTQQPVLQLRDASNNPVSQAGVSVTAAVASGGGTLSGTTSVSTDANGTATFTNLAITGSGAQTLRFSASGLSGATSSTITVPGSGGGGGSFVTPNILNNASFEDGWDGFKNWSGGAPDAVRDQSDAYQGTYSFHFSFKPNSIDDGTQTVYNFGATDRVWERFYFKLTNHITTIWKFARFYDQTFSNPHGGIFIQDQEGILSWGWDSEDASIVTPIGLTEAQVVNGQWHSIEVDYWRNGDPSGYPSVAFWFDGVQTCEPDGTSAVEYAGAGNKSYWKSCRLYAGMRSSSDKLGFQEYLATLNGGNTASGTAWIDYFSISTVGRIGP